VLLQFARVTRHKDLLEVPTARELIAFAQAPLLTMARPFAAPPGVPADRARALQAAFLATHRDPAFLAEAAKLGLDISPDSAGDLTRGIEELAHATPATLDYMRKLVTAENGG
jgi:tripartite-type tricarboxylate transporter receptor subunit TctC